MPVGLQIVGRTLGEYDVMRAAAAIERTKPPGYNLRPLTEP
jgi:aspartyl-tRNA(Asn)/glutamyl-tRNA(Gln) amidotransferase subunit A